MKHECPIEKSEWDSLGMQIRCDDCPCRKMYTAEQIAMFVSDYEDENFKAPSANDVLNKSIGIAAWAKREARQ